MAEGPQSLISDLIKSGEQGPLHHAIVETYKRAKQRKPTMHIESHNCVAVHNVGFCDEYSLRQNHSTHAVTGKCTISLQHSATSSVRTVFRPAERIRGNTSYEERTLPGLARLVL
jgi:hypothetical protein